MSVTYKDIDQLSQKSSVAGTEKLPVSDTEYISPNQIAGLVTVDGELSRTSENAIQNKSVTFAVFETDELTPTSTETGGYMKRDGDKNSVSNYAYKLYSVTEGRVYAFTIALGAGYTTGIIRAVVFLDSNGDVVSYSDYANSSSEIRTFINRLIVAPPGAVTAAVNYNAGYSWGGKLCLVSYATNAYVGAFAQTLTSAEQAQARTNIGVPSITVSSSEPTAQDGSDGDIWIVV